MYKRKDIKQEKWKELSDPKEIVQAIMKTDGFENGKVLIKNNHLYIVSRWTRCSTPPKDWTAEEFII